MSIKIVRTIVGLLTPRIAEITRGVISATKKDSDGGRTITPSEFEDLKDDLGGLAIPLVEALGVQLREGRKQVRATKGRRMNKLVRDVREIEKILKAMDAKIDSLAASEE